MVRIHPHLDYRLITDIVHGIAGDWSQHPAAKEALWGLDRMRAQSASEQMPDQVRALDVVVPEPNRALRMTISSKQLRRLLTSGDQHTGPLNQVGAPMLKAAHHGVEKCVMWVPLLSITPGPAHQSQKVLVRKVTSEKHTQVIQPVEQRLRRYRNTPQDLVELARPELKQALDSDRLDRRWPQVRVRLLVLQVGKQGAVPMNGGDNRQRVDGKSLGARLEEGWSINAGAARPDQAASIRTDLNPSKQGVETE